MQAKKPKLQMYELLIMIKSRLELMQNIALEQNKEIFFRKTGVSWHMVYSIQVKQAYKQKFTAYE
jgi:hypothetical protein